MLAKSSFCKVVKLSLQIASTCTASAVELSLFHYLVGQKKPSSDVFGDVVAHDRNLLLKINYSNQDHLGGLNVIISQTVINRANITIANT